MTHVRTYAQDIVARDYGYGYGINPPVHTGRFDHGEGHIDDRQCRECGETGPQCNVACFYATAEDAPALPTWDTSTDAGMDALLRAVSGHG